MPAKGNYLPFEEARAFVHKLKLNSNLEWRVWAKSNERPNFITSKPERIYKDKGWVSWGDFLGTGTISSQGREYLPFEEAKAYVHTLKLKSLTEWYAYSKSGEKPSNVPSNPYQIYRSKGWVNCGDWLGTGRIHPKDRVYLPFEEARKFVHSLGFTRQKEWVYYSKSDKKPDNIPSTPNEVYKGKGWVNYGDWLGTGRIHTKDRVYLPYNEAKAIIKEFGINSQKEWFNFRKSNRLPDNIPSTPNEVYKGKGWVNYGDWLSTGNIAPQNREYLSFEEAREYVQLLGLEKTSDWKEYSKSGKKPNNIPSNPEKTYRDKGWVNYGDWLGTGNIAPQLKSFIELDELKKLLRHNNIKTLKTYHQFRKDNPHLNIPSQPDQIYNKQP
jgi:hypothetical protein